MAGDPVIADAAWLADVADDLVEFETLVEDHALAVCRLWDRRGVHTAETVPERFRAELVGKPRTSQRALVALLAHHRTVYGGGGNRSGKTYGIKSAFVALALGSDHPDARAFWRSNDIDPDAFPAGPANADFNDGEVWIVAKSSAASIEYHRSAVEVMLPAGSYRWNNRDGKGMATLRVECPGYNYPAIIRFKSDDQGRDRMQGQKCRGIWQDEEGQELVWDECNSRLVDSNGWHVMTNTPVAGITWVEGRLVAKTAEHAEADCVVYHIHSIDNPHLDAEGLAKLGKGNDAMREAKLFGRAVSREGLVWDFDPRIHVVPRFAIPEDWLRFRTIDFGTRNPFACLWFTRSTSAIYLDDGRTIPDGSIVVYREHYQAERTLKHHAARIHELEGWEYDAELELWTPGPDAERIELSWADPEDAQQLLALVHDHDIDAAKALKAVSAGCDLVAEYLEVDETGAPRLFFFDDLRHTLREVPAYAWVNGSSKTDQPNRPKKKDDHTCDCVRYGVMGIHRY